VVTAIMEPSPRWSEPLSGGLADACTVRIARANFLGDSTRNEGEFGHSAQSIQTPSSPARPKLAHAAAWPIGNLVEIQIAEGIAVAIRPGEHACCRFAHAEDRRRLAAAFVRAGLARGHKVIYLCTADEATDLVTGLAAHDDQVEPALERGQLVVRPVRNAYMEGGAFDIERMLTTMRSDQRQAIADGYTGISITGEMDWALDLAPTFDQLTEYERRLAELAEDGTLLVLCQYDHGSFAAGVLTEIACAHGVDVSPELAAIGREGSIAAARVDYGRTLRLAGELDFGCSDTVAGVLDAHFHGTLRFDLADLTHVDVSGMRALRGRKGQPVTITAASGAVDRLLSLVGWDTDPDIEVIHA
jgi:ABC-type transporter Mla MlaB component